MSTIEKLQIVLEDLGLKYKKQKDTPAIIVGFDLRDEEQLELLLYIDDNLDRITFMFFIKKIVIDVEKAMEYLTNENSNHIVYGCISLFENKITYHNNISIINRSIEKDELNDYIMYSLYLFEKMLDWPIYKHDPVIL